MRKILLGSLLALSVCSYAVELGVKVGNARINWKDADTTTMEGYLAVYGEYMFPIAPIISVGPMVEIGYGRKNIGTFYCLGYGICEVDLTYTTFEVNGKAILDVSPVIELFGGAGISTNRFGIDARDLAGSSVGTLGDENGAGVQAFAGAQLTLANFGASLEYKYKSVNTDSIKSVDVVTLNLFIRF